MSVLGIRVAGSALVHPHPAPLPYEAGDIFEVRPEGCRFSGMESTWCIDNSPRRRMTFWWVHVPSLCISAEDIPGSQRVYSEPDWLIAKDIYPERTKSIPTVSWVRGCWIDIDALEYRHLLSLQSTGHCYLTLPEAQLVFHSMTNYVESDLSRH